MKKNENVGFNLKWIKTEQFATFEENISPNEEKIGLSTSVQIKLDRKNRQIGIFTSFEFKQNEKKIIKLVVSCHFSVKEDSWKAFLDENEIKLPKGFVAHVTMITVGTSRGILFAKTENTVFSKFILPTLDVASMFKEDVSFDIEN